MFNFGKKSFESSAEVFTGISAATIEDIQAYLGEEFGIDNEEHHDGGSTTFTTDGVPEEKREEAITNIAKIVGEKFEVALTEAHNEDQTERSITITSKTQ